MCVCYNRQIHAMYLPQSLSVSITCMFAPIKRNHSYSFHTSTVLDLKRCYGHESRDFTISVHVVRLIASTHASFSPLLSFFLCHSSKDDKRSFVLFANTVCGE